MDVLPGQTYAFLGVNGAGKTTTIGALMGLLKPDAGAIRVLGYDPRRTPRGPSACRLSGGGPDHVRLDAS